jgi:hypothetical protein
VAGLLLAIVAVAGSVGCYEFWYGVKHERLLARLVDKQATEPEIVQALQLGEPDFTIAASGPVLTIDGMISAWSISEELAREIQRRIEAHSKTIVFARTMVDFIYLDDTGRAAGYTMFGN